MNPIFSYVEPLMLFKETPQYEHLLIILYKDHNSDFKKRFRQNMGKYHIDSGKNIGLFVFDFPTDKWLRDNFDYFLQRYKRVSTDEDWRFILEDISKSRSEKIKTLKEWLVDIESNTYQYMDNLMRIFKIAEYNLPALIIYTIKSPSSYYLKLNIAISDIDNVLWSLTSKHNINLEQSCFYNFPKDVTLLKTIEMLQNGYSSEFWNIAHSIYCNQIQKQKEREPITKLIEFFPEFKQFKYPQHFEWHRDLLKWLKKYRNLVEKYVKQLNVLVENPNNPGLGLERIKNFWRFRITDKYRSHYFEENNKKVPYFLGYHDYYN